MLYIYSMEDTTLNIAIVDDLKADAQTLINLLHIYFSQNCTNDILNISEFQTSKSFLNYFELESYDFIFLDYYMDEMTGMDIARKIRTSDRNTILIFTTKSSDYAIDSYKVKASGYLVKPFSYEELAETISLLNLKKIRDKRFISIHTKEAIVKIILRDIIYCDISGHYTQLHTSNIGIQKFRMPFHKLEQQLSSYHEFLPCYRGCLINLTRVAAIEELNFLMDNNEKIPFRRKKQKELIKKYSDFLFEKARSDIL